jgi:cytoskeletal protein RodZ
MEPSTILVLVLIAGVFALLIWFEINSRQNEARMKQKPSHVESESGPQTEIESNVQSETEHRKAA